MTNKNTIVDVVKGGLCTSCGICNGVCPKDCISFYEGKERNTPMINLQECVSCGLCYDVCPGKGISLVNLSKLYFTNEFGVKNDDCAGYYRHAFVGHSTDGNVRMHCATGGMITQFLIWLLERGEIDGAVVVRYKKTDILTPESFIAKTKEELWESRSSKYVVLSMDKVAKEIAKGLYKKLIVVGLPCQIQGWRQLADKNRNVRKSIKGYFAIYCSLNKTKLSMEYYLQRYHVKKSDIGRFAFRDDGCLGYMKFEDKQGKIIKRIAYRNFWFGTHSFFTNPRCLMCIDHLGELADISFGDIHIKPYSDDKIGTNSIITRSIYWDNLLALCKADGAVVLDEIPMETLVRSQLYAKIYKKGAGAKAYMNIRKMFGKDVPQYDYHFEGRIGLKALISALAKVIMGEIGRHRLMWWIVKILDTAKDDPYINCLQK